MDPQFLLALQEISATLKDIAQTQQHHFVATIACALVYLSGLVIVAWRLEKRLDARHAETSKTLSDITAIAQTIAAQNRDVLRRLEP